MGAMLVCGIMPVGKPIDIPAANNISLRNRIDPASERDVARAHKVLKEWVEWHVDDGKTPEQALTTNLDTPDYLEWCQDRYENTPDFFRPTWWNYWEAFCGWGHQTSAPSPAPRELVERAIALEYASSLRPSERHQIASQPPARSDDVVAYVKRVCTSINATGRSPIAKQIMEAIETAGDPRSPSSVWAELCKVARSKKYASLKYVSDIQLEIPGEKSGLKPYTQKALQQFLNRHKPK